MKFYDMDDDHIWTVADLHREWLYLKKTDPWNYDESFKRYMLGVVLATINGRNNLEICEITPREVSNLVKRLKGECIWKK